MFSRAIATRPLCLVVLSQRQVFNQKDEVIMQYLFMEMVLELEFLTIASTAHKILFAIT